VPRRPAVGLVKEIRIIARELGNPPHTPVISAVFEFSLTSGVIIESTENFGPEGIIEEGLQELLVDMKRVAGLIK
jgi:hypothetical protein